MSVTDSSPLVEKLQGRWKLNAFQSCIRNNKEDVEKVSVALASNAMEKISSGKRCSSRAVDSVEWGELQTAQVTLGFVVSSVQTNRYKAGVGTSFSIVGVVSCELLVYGIHSPVQQNGEGCSWMRELLLYGAEIFRT